MMKMVITGIISLTLLLLVGSVVLGFVVQFRKRQNLKPTTPSKPPTTTPEDKPKEKPTAKKSEVPWWKWVAIFLFLWIWVPPLVVLCVDWSPKSEKVAESADKATVSASPTTITLTKEDGWVAKDINFNGTRWVANVTPHTAKYKIRTPDGNVHECGYGHEDDTWPIKNIPQSLFFRTAEDGPIKVEIVWK